MSGGSNEFTMGNYDNITSSSGISNILSIDSKYIDRYVGAGNYDITKYGDAVYETSSSASGNNSWFGDYSYITDDAFYPWFLRGGHQNSGLNAGSFYFGSPDGSAYIYGGFRVVLLVHPGL